MSADNAGLRIERLELSNYRCFAQLDVRCHANCTLFFGPNGRGKTAVLEAAAAGLAALFVAMENVSVSLLGKDDRRRIIREDLGASSVEWPTPVAIHVAAALEGRLVQWTVRPRARHGLKRSAAGTWGADIERRIGQGATLDLPVIVYYPASRLWDGEADEADDSPGSRLDAYAGCLSANTTLVPVATWLRRLTYAAAQRREPSPHLEAVRAAVLASLPELSDFYYDIGSEDLRVRLADGSLQSVGLLSDGYRNLIGLTADLAWRAARLNPHLGGEVAQLVSGVVLIDEIDVHLHPTWQRRVLPNLLATFPNVQFLVTTHSPQILGSAKREWTRVLDGAGGVEEGAFVEGRDSNAILTDVMGDRERQPEMQARLNALLNLIDDGDLEAARRLIEELESFFGPEDAELLRARSLIATVEAFDADDHEGA